MTAELELQGCTLNISLLNFTSDCITNDNRCSFDVLSEFSKNNLITVEKGEVQIQKHKQLEEIANMYD